MYDFHEYDNYDIYNHPLLRNTLFDNINIDDSSTCSSPSSYSLLENNKYKKEREDEESHSYKDNRKYKRKKTEPILHATRYTRSAKNGEKEKNNDNDIIIIKNEKEDIKNITSIHINKKENHIEIPFPTNEMIKHLSEEEFDIIYYNLKQNRTLNKDDIEILKYYRRKIKNRLYAKNSRNEKKILIQTYKQNMEKLIKENIYLNDEINRLNNIIIKYDANLLT